MGDFNPYEITNPYWQNVLRNQYQFATRNPFAAGQKALFANSSGGSGAHDYMLGKASFVKGGFWKVGRAGVNPNFNTPLANSNEVLRHASGGIGTVGGLVEAGLGLYHSRNIQRGINRLNGQIAQKLQYAADQEKFRQDIENKYSYGFHPLGEGYAEGLKTFQSKSNQDTVNNYSNRFSFNPLGVGYAEGLKKYSNSIGTGKANPTSPSTSPTQTGGGPDWLEGQVQAGKAVRKQVRVARRAGGTPDTTPATAATPSVVPSGLESTTTNLSTDTSSTSPPTSRTMNRPNKNGNL